MICMEVHPNGYIPEELYYDGWQTDEDKNGRTPLMIWIDSIDGEVIPKSLLEGHLKL